MDSTTTTKPLTKRARNAAKRRGQAPPKKSSTEVENGTGPELTQGDLVDITRVKGDPQPGDVQVFVVDLTKVLARSLLAVCPDYQRKVRDWHVEGLSTAMESKWQISFDAIGVTVDGDGKFVELVNGQHRVRARLGSSRRGKHPIVLLCKPAESRGDLDSSYLVADTGVRRSWSDLCKSQAVKGHMPAGKASQLSTLISNCHQMDNNRGVMNRGFKADNEDRWGWWMACDQELAIDCCRVADRLYKRLGVTKLIGGAFVYMAKRDTDPIAVDRFVEILLGDVIVDNKRNAAVLMRERFIHWRNPRNRPDQTAVIWNMLLRAYHNYLGGEEVKSLQWNAHQHDHLPVRPKWWVGGDDEANGGDDEANESDG